jgi:hypothetical protein
MIRYLLGAIAALFFFRVFFQIARALSRSEDASRSAPRGSAAPGSEGRRGEGGSRRARSRVRAATERERASAIEVPFTEIPPEEPARRP